MTRVLRRLRAVALTAVSWAAGWAVLGVVFRVVWPLEAGVGRPSVQMLLWALVDRAYPGAVSGAVFALLLIAGAPRRLEELSLPRMVLLGALGGTLLPVVFVTMGTLGVGRSYSWAVPLVPQFLIAGALCGAATLAFARRGPGDAPPRGTLPAERVAQDVGVRAGAEHMVEMRAARP